MNGFFEKMNDYRTIKVKRWMIPVAIVLGLLFGMAGLDRLFTPGCPLDLSHYQGICRYVSPGLPPVSGKP
jgi:hypothetical protein